MHTSLFSASKLSRWDILVSSSIVVFLSCNSKCFTAALFSMTVSSSFLFLYNKTIANHVVCRIKREIMTSCESELGYTEFQVERDISTYSLWVPLLPYH